VACQKLFCQRETTGNILGGASLPRFSRVWSSRGGANAGGEEGAPRPHPPFRTAYRMSGPWAAPAAPDANTFRIFISTDNHLGYAEKHEYPPRQDDSFLAVEEVLENATASKVFPPGLGLASRHLPPAPVPIPANAAPRAGSPSARASSLGAIALAKTCLRTSCAGDGGTCTVRLPEGSPGHGDAFLRPGESALLPRRRFPPRALNDLRRCRRTSCCLAAICSTTTSPRGSAWFGR